MPPKSSPSAKSSTVATQKGNGTARSKAADTSKKPKTQKTAAAPKTPASEKAEPAPEQPTVAAPAVVPDSTAQPSGTRWRWQVAAVALGVVAATTIGGYLLAAQGPEVWAADSEVRVRIAPEIAFADADRLLQTERLRVESFGLLGPVADDLDISIEDLREAVDAEPILGSEVLAIRAENRSSERALEINDAVTAAFIAAINESDLAMGSVELDAQRAVLEEDLQAASERFEEAEAAYVAERLDLPVERRDEVTRSQLDLAETELDRVSGQIRDITAEQRQLDIRNSTTRGADIITPGHVLEDPIAPTPLRGGAAGALIGLVIAAALIAVLTRPGRPSTREG